MVKYVYTQILQGQISQREDTKVPDMRHLSDNLPQNGQEPQTGASKTPVLLDLHGQNPTRGAKLMLTYLSRLRINIQALPESGSKDAILHLTNLLESEHERAMQSLLESKTQPTPSLTVLVEGESAKKLEAVATLTGLSHEAIIDTLIDSECKLKRFEEKPMTLKDKYYGR